MGWLNEVDAGGVMPWCGDCGGPCWRRPWMLVRKLVAQRGPGGVVRGVVVLVEEGWMAEKNWVMAGWEGSVVRR